MTAIPQPWNNEVVSVDGIPQREFHEFSIRHGVHCVPVDEEEEKRQDEFHEILLDWSCIGRVVYPANVVPINVLDCGCGTGAWGKEVLDQYEDSYVFGVDVFTARDFEGLPTKRWNLNAPLRLGPPEVAQDRYDLINSRFLTSGIDRHRWPSYVEDLFNRLEPGGWLQMTEAYMNIQSDSGRRDEAPNISRWWDLYSTALEQQGKDPRVGTAVTNVGQRAWVDLANLLAQTGFMNVETEKPRLPIGEWASTANSREIGGRVLKVTEQTLHALGVWACCRVHQMTADAFAMLIDGCVREMENPGLKLYIQIVLVWGQKPRHDRKKAVVGKVSSKPYSGHYMPPPSWSKT